MNKRGDGGHENIVAPFVKHCLRNYRRNLHAPLNWSLLSRARWFIPPSSFRFTPPFLPPIPSFFFHFSFFIFQLSSRNENAYISKSRQRDTQRVEAYLREKKREKKGKEEGGKPILCDIAKGVWRTMAIFRNGLLEKEKKKKKGNESTGGGLGGWNNAIWIYDPKKDAWSEDRDRGNIGNSLYPKRKTDGRKFRTEEKWRRKKEIVSRIFDAGRRNVRVGVTTWNSMEDENGKRFGRRRNFFPSFDRSREYRFQILFPKKKRKRNIFFPVKNSLSSKSN